jgi:hypothetical protein
MSAADELTFNEVENAWWVWARELLPAGPDHRKLENLMALPFPFAGTHWIVEFIEGEGKIPRRRRYVAADGRVVETPSRRKRSR